MGSAAESNERSGHTEALYREHGAAVARLCRSLLRDRADAEDAAQQVFLSAHRALLSGAVPREPLAWLLAVARNECYARFRQRASAPLPAGDAPDGAIAADASVQVVRAGELASVWDEVGRMPAAQREAFLLREVRGLSYRQVGAELSLSPPSVRSLLLRARTRLRRRLGDVAAGLGGAQWVQTILRLAAGGDAASPAPAAAKAAAVGLGAVALAGGAAIPRVVQHAATTHPAATAHHRAAAHVRHAAAPAVVPAVRVEHRQEASDRSAQATGRGSRDSGRSRSREGRDEPGVEDSGSVLQSRGSGAGAEAQATSAPAVQTTTSGHDGGGDSSSGSSGSSGGRSPGSDSGSVTTVATSGSSGSGSSGSGDSGGGDSHGSGSDGGSGGDGGGGHDGGSDG